MYVMWWGGCHLPTFSLVMCGGSTVLEGGGPQDRWGHQVGGYSDSNGLSVRNGRLTKGRKIPYRLAHLALLLAKRRVAKGWLGSRRLLVDHWLRDLLDWGEAEEQHMRLLRTNEGRGWSRYWHGDNFSTNLMMMMMIRLLMLARMMKADLFNHSDCSQCDNQLCQCPVHRIMIGLYGLAFVLQSNIHGVVILKDACSGMCAVSLASGLLYLSAWELSSVILWLLHYKVCICFIWKANKI